MIRIKELYINPFKTTNRELQIVFPSGPVSIIFGKNGSGKTTLLKIISGLLQLDSNTLMNEYTKHAKITFYDSEKNKTFFIEATLNDKEEREEDNYDWSTNIESDEIMGKFHELSSILFGVNRGLVSTPMQRIRPHDISRFIRNSKIKVLDREGSLQNPVNFADDLALFLNQQIKDRRIRDERIKKDYFEQKHILFENLSMDVIAATLLDRYKFEKETVSQAVQKALFETLAVLMDNEDSTRKIHYGEPKDFPAKLADYGLTLLEVLTELEENELSNKIINILEYHIVFNDDDDHINPFAGKGLLSQLVYNMIDELIRKKQDINSVSRLIELFNSYISSDKKLIVNENGISVITEENPHGINDLSSGERHLLSFLSLCIVEGNRDFLIIDEPEISLNIEWQSNLLKIINNLVPNAQIIVATHSPAIAEFNMNALVELKFNDK
ncbi:AAA family ATPase [Paenibacillus glycinis]|uniref:AAA family ATPase n=1 Tax=Paenibacillus glycinis TaxID=2697035 RepID=A0ABW9XZ74_9BACL|nr:AAA family ATPase [Paenibacillus glycinis]NBD28007.1 AAA family ATPase [Paenibacillus glycinis]